jgi:hypothetical protein
MSHDKNVVVYPQLRPPVASVMGNSPLRGKRFSAVFKEGGVDVDGGNSAAKEFLVSRYVDDGMIVDDRWNNRHNITASKFNDTNHPYYKVSFIRDGFTKRVFLYSNTLTSQ